MRWNEKILPPFHPPTVFTLYQPQLTHLPTIGGGGGVNAKPPRREDPSFNAKPNPGHATPLQVFRLWGLALLAALFLAPAGARAQSICTPTQTVSAEPDANGRYTTTIACADTAAAEGAADYRHLHYNQGPGTTDDPNPEDRGHVPPEQRREQQRQTHDSARRRVHRHRRRGHEDTAG